MKLHIIFIFSSSQIEIWDTDKFLGRAKGSRPLDLKRNQSLGHYIGKLSKETVVIYHQKFTTEPNLPFLAIKALSKVVGSYQFPLGLEKIIFVEKEQAIRVFGFFPGLIGSRGGYFGAMASYVLANSGDLRLQLAGYNKQKYLKFRGDIEAETAEAVEKDDCSLASQSL